MKRWAFTCGWFSVASLILLMLNWRKVVSHLEYAKRLAQLNQTPNGFWETERAGKSYFTLSTNKLQILCKLIYFSHLLCLFQFWKCFFFSKQILLHPWIAHFDGYLLEPFFHLFVNNFVCQNCWKKARNPTNDKNTTVINVRRLCYQFCNIEKERETRIVLHIKTATKNYFVNKCKSN